MSTTKQEDLLTLTAGFDDYYSHLDLYVSSPYDHKKKMKLYDHTMFCIRNGNIDELYNGVKQYIDKHLMSKVRCKVDYSNPKALWDEYKKLNSLISYMKLTLHWQEKGYINRNKDSKVISLEEYGKYSFVENVYEPSKDIIINRVVLDLNDFRDKNIISDTSILHYVSSLKNLRHKKTSKTVFDNLLNSIVSYTREYYSNVRDSNNNMSDIDYIYLTHDKYQTEILIHKTLFGDEYDILLIPLLEGLLLEKDINFLSAVQDERLFTYLYSFYEKIGKLSILENFFMEHISNIFKEVQDDDDIFKKYNECKENFKYLNKYDTLNNILEKTFSRVFHEGEMARIKFLSRYANSTLYGKKKANKNYLLNIYRVLDDETVLKINQSRLVKSLLYNPRVDIDMEKEFIDDIRDTKGQKCSQKLYGMIRDITSTKEYYATDKFNAKVLTKGYWPPFAEKITYPEPMQSHIKNFTEAYTSIYNMHALDWASFMDKCHITGTFNNNSIKMIMNSFQAAIVLLFSSDTSLTRQEIKDKLKVDEDKLNRALLPLLTGKTNILKEINNKISINMEYRTSKKTIRISRV